MNPRFLNIIKSSKPVIVDFYADWCIPCKEIPSILKEVKSELKEAVRIVKVNVDKHPMIATKYKIRNIPTLIVFKDGAPQWTAVGVCKADELKTAIRSQLNNN